MSYSPEPYTHSKKIQFELYLSNYAIKSDLKNATDANTSDFPKKAGLATIIHKIFETKSSFCMRQRTTGNVQFLFFREFLLVLTKCSFREED